MTCIVALKHDGKLYMGADSAASNGYDYAIRKDRKLFRKGDMLIGYTTSFRMGQIIQYHMKIPSHPEKMDTHEYMVAKFIPELQKALDKNHWLEKDNEVAKGGNFIVCYDGEIFVIDNDFQVGIWDSECAAVGCGESYALGSLYTSKDFCYNEPLKRIDMAIMAASEYSTGVRPPVIIEEL